MVQLAITEATKPFRGKKTVTCHRMVNWWRLHNQSAFNNAQVTGIFRRQLYFIFQSLKYSQTIFKQRKITIVGAQLQNNMPWKRLKCRVAFGNTPTKHSSFLFENNFCYLIFRLTWKSMSSSLDLKRSVEIIICDGKNEIFFFNFYIKKSKKTKEHYQKIWFWNRIWNNTLS